MSTYNTDHRAYEFWVDGNHRAADQRMNNIKTKLNLSANHIGAISLGFIHDLVNLQPMTSSENSSKNNSISKKDIKKLIDLEKKHSISIIS